ncbi:hypothetical protein D3C72_2159000 [compost metagenome]
MFAQGVVVGVGGPTVGGDLGDEVAALQKIGPVAQGISAGKSERKSNEGNTLCHSKSF